MSISAPSYNITASPFNDLYNYTAGCVTGAPSISPSNHSCGISNVGPIENISQTNLISCCNAAGGSNGEIPTIYDLGECTYYCSFNDTTAWSKCMGGSTLENQLFCTGDEVPSSGGPNARGRMRVPGWVFGAVLGAFVLSTVL